MNLILNGQPREVPDTVHSISDLLDALELGRSPVLVELNGEAVLNREFEGQPVRDGDVVEVIRMVAGG